MNLLDRQCEKYMGGPAVAYSERVHVTMDHKGRIFLNQKALKMMGNPLAVYLYYNREKDLVILEPTDALRAKPAFLLKDTQGTGKTIWANPFCRHFDIKLPGTMRFIMPETDAAGRMYLKLRETVNAGVGPRSAKKKKEAAERDRLSR